MGRTRMLEVRRAGLGGRHSTSEAPLSPSLTPLGAQWEGRGEGSLLGQGQAVHPNPHCTPQ